MITTLKNELLTVRISSHGAELQNILDNRTGHEYLWQGDDAFWGRRSPVLFPIVGAVWQGRYRMDGHIYELGQHGFARDMEFVPMDSPEDDEAWFALDWTEETLARYPRKFRLEIGYALRSERLTVMWRVRNLDTREMPFQIGAHPAFNYPDFHASDRVHAYFTFGAQGPLYAEVIKEKGCVGDEISEIVLDPERRLPVTAGTFSRDALIFAGRQVRRVSMLTKEGQPYLTVFSDAPLTGLWSKSADAPFVCIEPWWGRTDHVDYEGEFHGRRHIQTLDPGATFEASYLIILDGI